VFGISLKTDGVTKKMDTRTIHDVAAEMEAHERECSIYREHNKISMDKLESRIKRLEVLIMGSTLSIMGVLITLILKVL